MTDELRDRLRRADPAPAVPDPDPGPRLADLLERTMSTSPVLVHDTPGPGRSQRRLAAAAAAVVLTAGAGGALLLRDAGDAGSGGSEVRLALPGGLTSSSCLPFDAAFLRDMSPAFAGTVVSTGDDGVVLEVDRWYAGGTAERVVLETPDPTSSAALDGVAFEPGKRYLVTAADGTVNGCGFSGPATPELEAAFESAY